MDFVSRHSPSRIAAGTPTAARINQAEELIQIPWFYQLALEGRIFVSGHGIVEDGIDSESALDDQTPSVILGAPSSGTIVLPLYFRAYFDAEGGAGTPKILMAYVQLDKISPASSTATSPINCLGGATPRRHQAVCVTSASSLTAITDVQNVVLHERTHMIDNKISVEAVTTVQGVETFELSNFEFTWRPEMPITLRAGAAMLFYAHTDGGDSKYNYTIAWAELDEDTYKV